MTIQVIARDPDLVRRGYLPWRKLRMDHRHLAVSSWELDLTANKYVRDRTGPGWGAIILRDGEEILSGALSDDGPREWSTDDADSTGPGIMTVTGGDDLAVVANMTAWPNPTLAFTGQKGANYQDVRTGAAETLIKAYVAANIGTTRAATRRDAAAPLAREVVVAADLARGDSLSYSARFTPLMDLIRDLATGSNLGVQVIQQGSDLVFDVYEARDLSRTVRMSAQSGNLIKSSTTDSMPALTHAIVLGEGDKAAQELLLRSDSAAANLWRMAIEATVDSTATSDATELQAAGDKALADGTRKYVEDLTLVETPRVKYGKTFGRGDLITVVDPTRGTVISDIVTLAHIEADKDAGTETVTLTVGQSETDADETDTESALRVLQQKVDQLVRRTVPAAV